MKAPISFLAIAVCAFFLSAVAPITTTASAGSVDRLIAETYDDAIACGHAGEDCAVTPYLVCPSANARFFSYIATPYSRVAVSVFEAAKRVQPIKPMSPGEANGWGVGIYVFPNNNPRVADSIKNAVIKRGSEIIQPITTTLAPAVYRGAASPPLAKGYFAFPLGVFAPASSITVVLEGVSGTMECTLDPARLELLR